MPSVAPSLCCGLPLPLCRSVARPRPPLHLQNQGPPRLPPEDRGTPGAGSLPPAGALQGLGGWAPGGRRRGKLVASLGPLPAEPATPASGPLPSGPGSPRALSNGAPVVFPLCLRTCLTKHSPPQTLTFSMFSCYSYLTNCRDDSGAAPSLPAAGRSRVGGDAAARPGPNTGPSPGNQRSLRPSPAAGHQGRARRGLGMPLTVP